MGELFEYLCKVWDAILHGTPEECKELGKGFGEWFRNWLNKD